MLSVIGLVLAIGASGGQDQPPVRPSSLELISRPSKPPDTGHTLSSDELNAIGKRCHIGIWGGKDTIVFQGVEPSGQEEEYNRRRNCASRLIDEKGFKGTILVD